MLSFGLLVLQVHCKAGYYQNFSRRILCYPFNQSKSLGPCSRNISSPWAKEGNICWIALLCIFHSLFLSLYSRSHIYHEMEEPQENSMLASIRPNLHLRRKSMPAITGLDTFALSRIAESAAAASEAEAATSSTQARTSLEMDWALHLISFFENP